MLCTVSVAAPPRCGRRTPLELPQVLPQRGPGVFRARYAALLEQGNDLLHKRADVAWPETLPDGEAITADRLDGACQAVGDALGRPNERCRVETDLAGRDVPQGRAPAGQVEAVELAPDALDRPRLDRGGEWLIERVGGQVDLQQRRERRQAGLDRGVGVQRLGPLLGRRVGVADDRLGQEEDLAVLRLPPVLTHTGLEGIVELLHLVGRLATDDDGFGVTGREVLPALRRAGLDDDRASLRRRRGVERTARPVVGALEVDRLY